MSICKVFLQMCSQATISRSFQNESSDLGFANPSPLLRQLPINVLIHKAEHTNNLTLSNRTVITISNPLNISFYKKKRFVENWRPLASVLITSQNVNFVICFISLSPLLIPTRSSALKTSLKKWNYSNSDDIHNFIGKWNKMVLRSNRKCGSPARVL